MSDSQLHAQQWNWQSPLPQGNTLNDVAFIDGNTGFVIGGSGLMLQTLDRGGSWMSVHTGANVNLNRIIFVTADSGWIVGNNGAVLATADGGNTWTAQNSQTTNNLYDVDFIDHSTGYAVGDKGTIIRTTNAGVQWSVLTTHSTAALRGVSFPNAQFGFVVGYGGVVLNTVDHGDSWTSQVVDANTNLNAVWFSDQNTGWIAGDYGNIWHTLDGETTWSKDVSRTYERVNRITTVPGTYKIAVCDGGNVITAAISDSQWYSQDQMLTSANLYGVNVVADTGMYPYKTRLVGDMGEILTSPTNASSNSFTSLTPYTRVKLYSMCFTGATAGYAVGDSGFVYRTNNGSYWFLVNVGDYSQLRGIAFSPANLAVGLAVGLSGAVKWTKNAGDTWSQDTSSILKNGNFYSACFSPNGVCYIVGVGGVIYKYANSKWSAVTSPTRNSLFSVSFSDDNYGFVAGQSGAVYKTEDGGATWTKEKINTNQDIYGMSIFRGATTFNGVDSVDATEGWIVGNTGVVRHTADGGATWNSANIGLGAGGALTGVYFTDHNDGVTVGTNGSVFSTTNKGATWTAMTTPTNKNLNAVWLVNNSTGWTVGDEGTVLFNNNVGLPVELASFTGWAQGNSAMLKWNTASELNSSYFQIERRPSNGNWQGIATLSATGSVSQGASYQYADKGLAPNVYYYRLKEVDNDGSSRYVGNNVEITVGSAAQIVLYQNYPNPFKSSTDISFDLANTSNVRVVVVDMSGREVGTVQNGTLQAGHYDMNFDATNLPAGTYVYRMEVNGASYARPMIVVK